MSNPNPPSKSMADGGTPGGILLDAGTNELEVLVFRMGPQHYGVNVAKVREVIRGETPSEPPKMHSSVIGVINKRGSLIPLVDLGKHLGLPPVDPSNIDDARIIVTLRSSAAPSAAGRGEEEREEEDEAQKARASAEATSSRVAPS